MKTKLLTILALIGFLGLSAAKASENVVDKKAIELGVKMGMYIEKNKENILSWSKLIAYKTLEAEAEKYDCENKVKPSKNAGSEYIRGLCTFVNEKSKQDVYEGLNALAYSTLYSKNEDAKCATALALLTTSNYKAYEQLSRLIKSDSYLCNTAKNIVKIGLKNEMKYHNFLEPGNVCVE